MKNIKNTINRVLNEYYSPLSMDNKINELIYLEDKKELYKLVVNRDTEGIVNKIKTLTSKISGVLGEKSKKYAQDYLKRMVYKMRITYLKKED